MKKIFALSAIIAVISAPAIAVQKCVALNSGTSCRTKLASNGGYDWTLSCSTGRTSVAVSGISACSDVRAPAGTLQTNLSSVDLSSCQNSGTCVIDEPLFCWCRMISPAVSQWVSAGKSYSTARDCQYECASYCGNNIPTTSTLITAMFSTSTFSD